MDKACIYAANVRRDGYGWVKRDGVTKRAHRVAYEEAFGAIPDGHHVDHECHNEAAEAGLCAGGWSCPHRACIEPTHLRAVTPRVNQLASANSIMRQKAERTHCPRGHPLSGDNLHVDKRGCRRCKECNLAQNRERYARR